MSKGALGLLAAYWPEDTPRYAHVPLKLVTEVTVHTVEKEAPERAALVTDAGTVSYREVSNGIRAVAATLRARLERGARVAVVLDRPGALLTSALGAVEAGMVTWLAAERPEASVLQAFSPDLVVSDRSPGAHEWISPEALREAPEEPGKAARPDFKSPVLVLAKPDASGEVAHNQKTLSATAIAVSSFYMIDAETRVALLEPPTRWETLALLLGTWKAGGTVVAAWGAHPAPLPPHLDYVVCSWDYARRDLLEDPRFQDGPRIGAGAIVGLESGFSTSRRRRIARRLRAPVLTLFGRSDLGPVLGSHPTWFLDDAIGIPLPNVDTRPLDPSSGAPLAIGWDAVEEAELGVKSALAPAGGDLVEGWLRSHTVSTIDPTGVYFFRAPRLLS